MSRITIVGGGIMGSSIAYHMGRAGIARDITVIEPDPTYEFAATPRAVGGVRRLFGNRQNVEMSHYSRAVYTAFDKHVTGGAITYDPCFRVEGYMFHVAGAESVAALEACAEMQNSVGARVEVLDRAALKARYPSFRFDDVDAAALCAEDGRLDPHAVLMGYRRAAEGIGVSYRKARVGGLVGARARLQLRQLLGARHLRHGRHADPGEAAAPADLQLSDCRAVRAVSGYALPVGLFNPPRAHRLPDRAHSQRGDGEVPVGSRPAGV